MICMRQLLSLRSNTRTSVSYIHCIVPELKTFEEDRHSFQGIICFLFGNFKDCAIMQVEYIYIYMSNMSRSWCWRNMCWYVNIKKLMNQCFTQNAHCRTQWYLQLTVKVLHSRLWFQLSPVNTMADKSKRFMDQKEIQKPSIND